MRGIRCAVAAVLAAGIVTVVAAQPGGGFGGGFGGQDINTLVLTNTALQEELKITADQKTKLKPAADKQAELAKKQRELFGGGKKGEFDKEKFTAIQEEGKKVAEEVKKAVDETLTDAQKKRIKQISVQRMGVNVFAEPTEEGKGGKGGKGGGFGGGFQTEAQKATMKEVADALKLSDGQKSKVKDILSEHGKDLRAIRTDIFGDAKGGGFGKAPDPEKTKDFTAKSTKLSSETMGKIAEVLDDAQKKTWKELVGEPFDLAKLQPMIPKKD